MSKVGHWLKNSVVSRKAGGPGFESRSGHDFFLPCDIHTPYTTHPPLHNCVAILGESGFFS